VWNGYVNLTELRSRKKLCTSEMKSRIEIISSQVRLVFYLVNGGYKGMAKNLYFCPS